MDFYFSESDLIRVNSSAAVPILKTAKETRPQRFYLRKRRPGYFLLLYLLSSSFLCLNITNNFNLVYA